MDIYDDGVPIVVHKSSSEEEVEGPESAESDVIFVKEVPVEPLEPRFTLYKFSGYRFTITPGV